MLSGADAHRFVKSSSFHPARIPFTDVPIFKFVTDADMAISGSASKRLVAQGGVSVDDKKVDIGSYPLKEGQEISIAPGSKEIMPVLEAKESGGTISIPQWLESDLEKLKGKVLKLPEREDIKAPVNEQIIVELYSK